MVNRRFIIDTIHERRADIDMVAMWFEEKTHYAQPDIKIVDGEGDTEAGGLGISRQ